MSAPIALLRLLAEQVESDKARLAAAVADETKASTALREADQLVKNRERDLGAAETAKAATKAVLAEAARIREDVQRETELAEFLLAQGLKRNAEHEPQQDDRAWERFEKTWASPVVKVADPVTGENGAFACRNDGGELFLENGQWLHEATGRNMCGSAEETRDDALLIEGASKVAELGEGAKSDA